MKKKSIIAILAVLCAIGCALFALVWNGIILLNNPSDEKYPVRGVDVSAYQGVIDWQTLAAQDISFAFIKATEGSTFVDKNFAYNFEQARQTGLSVGAYHFFSYDSPGSTQAENFISNVVPFEGMLPPVIDLEFYGDKQKNPPDRAQVDAELSAIDELVLQENWEAAEMRLEELYGRWQRQGLWLHITTEHDALNEAEGLFRRALVLAEEEDSVEFRAHIADLRSALQLLCEMEQVRVENVL